jgi:hypothetical protein
VADVLFLAIFVAFFALMVAFVRFCEHIVGKDESVGTGPQTDRTTDTDTPIDTTPEEVPA